MCIILGLADPSPLILNEKSAEFVMINQEKPLTQTVNKTITINADAAKVWHVLTSTELMKQWMSVPDMEIITDWKVGNPFIIRGILHATYMENKGVVLQFDLEKILCYTHLSSLSQLPYEPGNYTVFEFVLTPTDQQTTLSLTISDFPTYSTYKHIFYYWNVTLELLKKFIENQ